MTRTGQWGLRVGFCICGACLLLFGGASVALGDTLSLSVSPDPAVEAADVHVSASGSTSGSSIGLSVYRAPADQGPCPDYPSVGFGSYVFDASLGPGPFSVPGTTSLPRGTILLCGWLVDNNSDNVTVTAAASRTLTVRPAHASLALHVPARVAVGQHFTTRVDYTLDDGVHAQLFVDTRPGGGAPCAPTSAQEPSGGAFVFGGLPIRGSGSKQTGGAFSANGPNLFCAWIETGPEATSALAGPASVTLTVRPGGGGKTYRGKTSQHLPISFAIRGGEVDSMSWKARYVCTGPQPKTTTVQPTDLFPFGIRHGRFSQKFASGSDHGTIAGRVRGHRVKGTMTESYGLQSGNTCRLPRKLTYTAKLR